MSTIYERNVDYIMDRLYDKIKPELVRDIVNEYIDSLPPSRKTFSNSGIYIHDSESLNEMLKGMKPSEIINAIRDDRYHWGEAYVVGQISNGEKILVTLENFRDEIMDYAMSITDRYELADFIMRVIREDGDFKYIKELFPDLYTIRASLDFNDLIVDECFQMVIKDKNNLESEVDSLMAETSNELYDKLSKEYIDYISTYKGIYTPEVCDVHGKTRFGNYVVWTSISIGKYIIETHDEIKTDTKEEAINIALEYYSKIENLIDYAKHQVMHDYKYIWVRYVTIL